MFGATVETDWRPGSAITWSGEYNGQRYRDKGQTDAQIPYGIRASAVQRIEPNALEFGGWLPSRRQARSRLTEDFQRPTTGLDALTAIILHPRGGGRA
jgi:hypothetical protein